MKKFIKILVVALFIFVVTIALVACEEKSTHKGDFTHEINNVDDLKKVSEMLGADYDKGVFELNTDIAINENWETIGDTVDKSFRGTFNGNGHTITYTINIPEPEERDVKNPIADDKAYGLFGVIHNAKITNLVLNVNIIVPADANSFYVGGLAGLMSGNNTISNVTINGNIATTLGDIRKIIDETDGYVLREPERYDMTVFVGGLAGFVQGNTAINGVNSSVNINVGAYGTSAGINDLFVGGVAGSMRTVNISSLRDNTEYCSAKNLTFTGSIDATGSLVNVGGIFGAAYRVNDGEKWFTNTSSINAQAYRRLRIGGIAGVLDRVNLNKTRVDMNSINANIFSQSASRSFNIGGLVGYVANFSNINNAVSDVDKICVSTDVSNYTGGLIGMLHFSNVTNATSSGELYYGSQTIMNINQIRYEGSTQKNHYYIYNGGMIGRVYGESKMNNVSTSFKAYQGLVGEVANAVEIVIIKEAEGETFDAWFANTVYDAGMTISAKEGKLEEGEQKYKIIHKYDLSNEINGETNLSFVSTNSKCYNDKVIYAKAQEWYNGIGVEQVDTTVFDALRTTIITNINA